MLRLSTLHLQPWTASSMHCAILTMQEGIWRGYWLTFVDMWMDKYTHDKQMDLTEPHILFDVLPAASPSGYTGCPRRNVRDFGRVFLMLNYTDITQNTYIQSWTVTEIMAIEKCGLLGCPRTVSRPWLHTRPLRMPGNETPLDNIVMQWPWRDNGSAAACVKYLGT